MKQTKKNKPTPKQVCSDCIHHWACAAWNVGSIESMDGTNCANFEQFDVKAVPVVHGRWVRVDGTDADWKCSVCKDEIGLIDHAATPQEAEIHYCPHCGGKMDKEGMNDKSGCIR